MLERLKDQLFLLQYLHLLWGLGLFVGLALWVYWPSRRNDMRRHGASILAPDSLSNEPDHDAKT